MQLERTLGAVLDPIDSVDYRDAGGFRLSSATPVVSNARTVLGKVLPLA